MKMGQTEFCLNIIATTVFRHLFFKSLDIIMFEKWIGINTMGRSAPWDDN